MCSTFGFFLEGLTDKSSWNATSSGQHTILVPKFAIDGITKGFASTMDEDRTFFHSEDAGGVDKMKVGQYYDSRNVVTI